MKTKNILIVLMLFCFTSCIKQVDLVIDPGETFMYIDAFITGQVKKQSIIINNSAPYLGDSKPVPVQNANVLLKNITKDKEYQFVYSNGEYIFNPSSPMVSVGDSTVLEININGVSYTASDRMYRVPEIDSVTLHYKSESFLYAEGIYGEVHIKDIEGATDYYWLKSTYNSNDPSEGNNLAIDGGYYAEIFDGLTFITPLREAINEYGPFSSGGKIDVRLRSISKPTYMFLELLFNASSGSGMFAEILKNIPTNVNSPENSTKLLGWYATSAERNMSVIIP